MIWNPLKNGSRLPDHVHFALLANGKTLSVQFQPADGWKPIFGFNWWLAVPVPPPASMPLILPPQVPG